eukprot:2613048-Rhodomonas_salina.1
MGRRSNREHGPEIAFQVFVVVRRARRISRVGFHGGSHVVEHGGGCRPVFAGKCAQHQLRELHAHIHMAGHYSAAGCGQF